MLADEHGTLIVVVIVEAEFVIVEGVWVVVEAEPDAIVEASLLFATEAKLLRGYA